MDLTKQLDEARRKLGEEHIRLREAFIDAILTLREQQGEPIDLNYIALEYGGDFKDGVYTPTLKVVNTRKHKPTYEEVRGKLLEKHNIKSGLIIHLFGEDYCEYSIVGERLGHSSPSGITRIMFKDLFAN